MIRFRGKLPATLIVAGCSAPSMMDAGYDAGSDAGVSCDPYVNDAGMSCGCIGEFLPDGGYGMTPYCDSDVGNPCPLGCSNPREADGGRQYRDDAGTPVCYC